MLPVLPAGCILLCVERASPIIVASEHPQPSVESPSERTHEQNSWIRIPRRPHWDAKTTTEDLVRLENEAFLEWRRGLAAIEDSGKFIMTPFERNIEIWRQLWRVIEACDVLVQIVDARNPLLFFCEDLCSYVNEVDPHKEQLLLINKADFLSTRQREIWANFFTSIGKKVYFYSARDALEDTCELADVKLPSHSDILNRENLLAVLKKFSAANKVGLIGYPNVGKSSTINSLVGCKKVAVASTPGKTKHFQTLRLDNGVFLYDCPGLVFPNFAASRADLVLNGVLPIDQLRDWRGPAELLIQRISHRHLSAKYGIKIPAFSGEDASKRVTASEVLSAIAEMRGLRTSFHGNPDESRAARIILKDYVNGTLLFCLPPPGFDAEEFNQDSREAMDERLKTNPGLSRPQISGGYSVSDDKNLRECMTSAAFLQGMSGTAYSRKPTISKDKKHWKGKKGHL